MGGDLEGALAWLGRGRKVPPAKEYGWPPQMGKDKEVDAPLAPPKGK